jgi:hypothetical protein
VKAINETVIRRRNRKPKEAHRPTLYNDKIAGKICKRLIMGESLNKICRSDEMPSTVTVYNWLKKYPEFENQYLISRDQQIELYADRLIDIADDAEEDIRISRLKIAVMQWYVSKLKRRRYLHKAKQGNIVTPVLRIEYG